MKHYFLSCAITISIASMLLFGGVGHAEIVSPFIPSDSNNTSHEENRIGLQEKLVSIDFESFSRESGPREIVLGLSRDTVLTAVKERFVSKSADRYTWFGRIKDDSSSNVVLTVGYPFLYGRVEFSGGVYKISPVRESPLHKIVKVDPNRVAPMEEDYLIPSQALEESIDKSLDKGIAYSTGKDDGSVIDIMILYTEGMSQAYPGNEVFTIIDYMVDLANQAYANSEIDLELNVVKTMAVSYPDETLTYYAIDDLTYGRGVFSDVPSMRDRYGADIVILVSEFVEENSTCGRAWQMESNSSSFENMAYVVVNVGNVGSLHCSDYAFAHEIGHNMGSSHYWFNECSQVTYPGVFGYSLGHCDTDGGFATIMISNGVCASRKGYFSNPNLTYNGYPMGIAEGEPCEADNAKSINITKVTIAQFRDSVELNKPEPGIKANHSEGSVTIGENDNLIIEIELDAGDYENMAADWWLTEYDNNGKWYYLDLDSMDWEYASSDITLTYQGPLFDLNSTVIPYPANHMAPGTYLFFFGVDLDMDGMINEEIFYDSVEVKVE